MLVFLQTLNVGGKRSFYIHAKYLVKSKFVVLVLVFNNVKLRNAHLIF